MDRDYKRLTSLAVTEVLARVVTKELLLPASLFATALCTIHVSACAWTMARLFAIMQSNPKSVSWKSESEVGRRTRT